MKVIGIDNFMRETVSDILIKENLTKLEAKKLANEKNTEYGDSDNAPYYYKVVDDDYELYDATTNY